VRRNVVGFLDRALFNSKKTKRYINQHNKKYIMINIFRNTILLLEKIGFMNVILPFMFIFVVIFGILEKAMIFGKNRDHNDVTKVHAIIAFVCGFTFVAVQSLVSKLNLLLYYVALLLVFIFLFQLISSIFLKDHEFNKWIILSLLVIIILIVLKIMNINIIVVGEKISSFIPFEIILVLAIFAAIIYYITRDKKDKKKKKDKKAQKANKAETKSRTPGSKEVGRYKPGDPKWEHDKGK